MSNSKFMCKYCGKYFASPSNLKTHENRTKKCIRNRKLDAHGNFIPLYTNSVKPPLQTLNRLMKYLNSTIASKS